MFMFTAVAALLLAFALVTSGTARAAKADVTYAQWSESVKIPSSSGSFQGASGGDGFDVFFDDAGHVFNIWHHQASTGNGAIDCHTLDGTSCGAAWPFKITPLTTDDYSTGYVDNANKKLWFPTTSGTASGFGCVDLANMAAPAMCAGVGVSGFVGIGSAASYQDVGRLAVVDGKLFTLAKGGNLLCLDTATSAPCSTPSVLATDGTAGNARAVLVATDGKVFGAAGTGTAAKAFCFVASNMSACTGFTAAVGAISATTNQLTVYLQPDSAGVIDGVCFREVTSVTTTTATCVKPDASASATANAGLASAIVLGTDGGAGYYAVPGTLGTRVFYGGGFDKAGELGCYDVATSASCAGWPVKSPMMYATTFGPGTTECVWTNSDPGKILVFKLDGTPGCTFAGADTATAKFAPVLPCASGTIAGWSSFALTAPAVADYTAATLTVTKANGTVVKSGGKTWKNVKVTGKDRKVSLAGLAVKDTGTNPSFTVSYTGRKGEADSTASIVMAVAKAAGCTKTVTAPVTFAATTKSTAKKSRMRVGDSTNVTFRASNRTAKTSKGTKIVSIVPRGFRLVSAPGATVKGRTVTWTIGNLKSKAAVERSMTIEAIGRGRHAVGFAVTSTNLASTTGTVASILIRGTAPEAVTG